MVHRTYMGASIQLRVYDDRLSIWNEGLLPSGLSLEDLKVEHNSRPRNPKITDTCFFAGFIDTWGRGTIKIMNACKEAGLAAPEIKEMNGGVMVTIFNDFAGSPIEKNYSGLADGLVKNDNGGQAGGQAGKLTDKQKEVYNYIVDNPAISRSKLAEKLCINESAVQKHIDALKNKGYIQRKGETTGYWIIKK